VSTESKIRDARARAIEAYTTDIDSVLSTWPESPIERLFLAELIAEGWREGGDVGLISFHAYATAHRESGIALPSWSERLPRCLNMGSGMMWVSQLDVHLPELRCRLDFALLPEVQAQANGVRYRVAVELDGHDFHERTKEQARRDKQRDRVLQTAGWIVLRFAGSEVFADPHSCEVQAVRAAVSTFRSKP
jgi:hypothetical protein